jgi:hypothetical protein
MNHQPTVGIEFGVKIIDLNGIPVKLQIYDTVRPFLYHFAGRAGSLYLHH